MPKKTGRPLKEINQKDFESLLAIQCTQSEVVSFFDMKLNGCSRETLDRWCNRTYGKPFGQVAKEKREIGKISLRRTQFRMAEKSVPMAIFLGKNYLDQTDITEQKVEVSEPVRIIRSSDGGIMVDVNEDDGK